MSPELKQFYKDLHHWVITGENPEGVWFGDWCGLCNNLIMWEKVLGGEECLIKELERSFKAAGLHPDFPFDVDYDEYSDCSNKYTNPARLEWIARHAA